MKSSYKRLGNYIRRCDEINEGMKVDLLLGINNAKYFVKAKTNTNGIDLQKYRIVRNRQFAFNRATTRNGNKISIALRDGDDCIVSPSYRVFEVEDENILSSEYLMMWFRRPEFDRYARYKSHGSAHEFFDWEEMCDVRLPIPHIDEQREIVKEYDIIVNRIKLNEKLIQNLEETSQSIYKQWFVDFDFPDDNNQPYKSSGGEMIFNDKLELEIPNGWEVKSFTKVVRLSGGGTPNTNIESYWDGNIPFFTPKDVNSTYFTINTEKYITESGLNKCSSKLYPKGTVFVTARGTVGAISMAGCEMAMNQSCYAVLGNSKINQIFAHQLTLETMKKLKEEAIGAVFNALVTRDFDGRLIIEPNIEILDLFENRLRPIYNTILNKVKQNEELSNLRSLLLSKLTTVTELV
ncbi:restriction endonuclease subunit S [Pontibacter sp. H259]|uniref:restriction endonuclease subunit S n=1 Tax=Pontibacter sp. H259 TaxID=3133421 RepID=UPI0030BA3C98